MTTHQPSKPPRKHGWRWKDMTGQRIGRLVVVAEVRPRRVRYVNTKYIQTRTRWRCRCDCGKTKIIEGITLRTGKVTSCGCYKRELARQRMWTHVLPAMRARYPQGPTVKHGQAHYRHPEPEYSVWLNMLQRTTNPKNDAYKNYGGRGITVCERWRDAANFLADMGKRPSPKHTIERRNNDGNYTPENCCWATRKEQAANQRPRGVFVDRNPLNGRFMKRREK